MPTYSDEISKKNFTPNVVMKVLGTYFAIHEPDSGLTVPVNSRCIKSVTLNPSVIDLKKVTQSIASFSIRVSPKENFTALLKENTTVLINEVVEIYLGRVGVNMAFSDYTKISDTRVRTMDYVDGTFNIRTREAYDLMTKEVFNTTTNLTNAINDTVTTIQMDTQNLPASGKLKITNEILTYTSKDATNIYGVTRGVDSDATGHGEGIEVKLVYELNGNPIDLLLQILISNGGGGSYDVLPNGLGIDEDLIDIAQFLSIKNEFFSLTTFDIEFFEIQDTLKELLEKDFLQPLNIRLVSTSNNKIGIAILDQAEFSTTTNEIDENSLDAPPKWKVEQDKIYNNIEIRYDYNVARNSYEKIEFFEDTDSITFYGKSKPVRFSFRGVKTTSGGSQFINDFQARFLARFSDPTPQISVDTQMDKSLFNVGDKVILTSRELPSASGNLNFADTLEIISRSINHTTGKVKFKLAYTSYTGVGNLAYIAPASTITSVVSQSNFNFGSGLGDQWELGYVIRLFNKSTCQYETDGTREIISVSGDNVTIDTPWSTTLIPNVHLIRFADYDDVIQSQKKFCFVGQNSEGDFPDGSPVYRITL